MSPTAAAPRQVPADPVAVAKYASAPWNAPSAASHAVPPARFQRFTAVKGAAPEPPADAHQASALALEIHDRLMNVMRATGAVQPGATGAVQPGATAAVQPDATGAVQPSATGAVQPGATAAAVQRVVTGGWRVNERYRPQSGRHGDRGGQTSWWHSERHWIKTNYPDSLAAWLRDNPHPKEKGSAKGSASSGKNSSR